MPSSSVPSRRLSGPPPSSGRPARTTSVPPLTSRAPAAPVASIALWRMTGRSASGIVRGRERLADERHGLADALLVAAPADVARPPALVGLLLRGLRLGGPAPLHQRDRSRRGGARGPTVASAA